MDTVNRAIGIDVSHHQGVVDFSAVLNSGVSFVGVKAVQGQTFTDPMFLTNRAGVRSQPFTLAVYYAFAGPGDPVKQADRFMDVVGELRANERLCLDLEDDKTGMPAVDLKWADKFYTRLLGGACSDRRPLLYTSRRVWLQLKNPDWDLASEIDLWAPRYGPDEPELPKPWKAIQRTWSFWQFTQDAIIPGITGPCDSSRFNGDEAALKAYASVSRPPPAPSLLS